MPDIANATKEWETLLLGPQEIKNDWQLQPFGTNEPYEPNKALNAMMNLSLLADWYLTDRGVAGGGQEINPILGPKPSSKEIGAYFLTFLLGNALLPKILGPEYADAARAQLLSEEIPCLESWTNPGFSWDQHPEWKLTIPFKF